MDLTTRKTLTQSLSKLTVEIAAALRVPMRTPGAVQDAAQALHHEEQVGEAFDLWTDVLSRRAAVLWVLKSLYVRILEDRGLLQPRRILDAEDDLFRHLAPNLGPTAYLRWVYRDLASLRGGLPELFAPQPAELSPVPDGLSQRLIDFWRNKNPDTGDLLYRFDDEHFDSRLMGDLYQDLDPVVKKRYALLQTPDFVLDFILDETLTPAIAEWGVETVRVLDPACGSGHFLLAAFKRIVAGMRAEQPARPVREVVEDVLSRVVGIDLNDYACGLARARLVMTALETCGETDLAAAASFHPRVFWADALEQVEEEEQLGLATIADDHGASMALLTPPEVRAALRPELKKRFHVVVGNPPYITEKDPARKRYHMQRCGQRRRYVSAIKSYSLGAPFTERMLQLSVEGGFVGEITADSFMKREFGKALIEDVLSRRHLTKVVSTAGAFIPGHGTPTVLIFARNASARDSSVRVVMGKRGEPGKPHDPARGKVWTSILEGHGRPGFENDFVSVADVPATTLAHHPWSVGGGGASELKTRLDGAAGALLRDLAASVGIVAILGEDEAFLRPRGSMRTASLPRVLIASGEEVGDWTYAAGQECLRPYDPSSLQPEAGKALVEALWPFRATLQNRIVSGSTSMREAGRVWFDLRRIAREKIRAGYLLVFGAVSTHPQVAMGREGDLFKDSAPVVKFPPEAARSRCLTVLAQLNSSVACFWLKQVCQDKGIRGEGGGFTPDAWEHFFQFGGTKLEGFPLAATDDTNLLAFGRALDRIASERLDDSPSRILEHAASDGATALRAALAARRTRDEQRLNEMVALQEELDWLCYRLYGIDPGGEVRVPDAVPPLPPALRAFEITLARENVERVEAVVRGEEPDEPPTQWFARHGWQPQTTLEAVPAAHRTIVEARVERTQASRDLSLLEQPTYKRRWYKPNYEQEEREALELWLDDRLEAWAKERTAPFTAPQAGAALRADPGILAVGELLTGRSDFDVDALLEERLRLAAVPNLKHHVFKAEGLLKRAEWERTWEEQHKEDRGEPAKPAVPPKYGDKDYLRKEYWAQRGKLDVPKERFIAFTEVPPPTGAETLYGWAGWTPRERAKVMLGLDEQLEAAGVKVADRHGLLYGVWFLLPYVAWESADAARDFRADVRSLVGENGVTEAMLDEWAKRFPPPRAGSLAKQKPTRSTAPSKRRGAKAEGSDA